MGHRILLTDTMPASRGARPGSLTRPGLVLLFSVLLLSACSDGTGVQDAEMRARDDAARARSENVHASGEVAPVPMAEGEHASVACARCHDGVALARAVPEASAAACIDCHSDRGPRSVSLGTIVIEHRDHGGSDAVAAECASCHTHRSGRDELSVTTTGCTLCHAANLDGASPEGCRLCHTDPGHVALTSQNVPVPHASLPWIGGECVRCHFDVGRPATTVTASACVVCHRDAAAVTEQGAGLDLHPAHTGTACSSCHENVSHHVVAMSSGVDLACWQCHATAHDVTAGSEFPAATCNGCHTAVHAAEQRLMLGVGPAGLTAAPSDKFLVGLTCRSCHVQSSDGASIATNCVACHSPEYATVLRWWERGSAERLALTERYVAAAATAATTDSARALAAAADSLLRFVRQGGAAHNLPLSHRALEDALTRAAGSWTATGRNAPAVPDLGRAPRMGQCTYCHYLWREPVFQLDMPDAFHRRVMSQGEEAARRLGPAAP